MNITLSIDKKTVERARQAARAMGKSLNQLLREYMEQVGGQPAIESEIEEFRRLSLTGGGRSRGWKFDRDELHERRG